MKYLFIALLFFNIKDSLAIDCLDCTLIRCPELETSDCPEGTVLTDNVIMGCCPACVRYLELGAPCPGVVVFDEKNWNFYFTYGEYRSEADDKPNLPYPKEFVKDTVDLPCSTYEIEGLKEYSLPERVFSATWATSPRDNKVQVPVIDSARCAPFLTCKQDRPGESEWTTCEHKELTNMYCAQQTVDYWQANRLEDCSVRYWEPSCDVSTGTYNRLQQKSNAANYWCSDPYGEAIFGKEKKTVHDPEINCLCSRKRWELSQPKELKTELETVVISGRKDVSLHCKMNGNYEELQCDKQLCWCIDPDSGEALSKVVPESMLRFLPCYDRVHSSDSAKDNFGGQYLRKCEARKLGMLNTTKYYKEHGTTWNVDIINCDATGGFDKKRCINDECKCVSSAGEESNYRFTQHDSVEKACSCARDYQDGLTTNLECNAYGNYNTIKTQTIESEELQYCVDPYDNWRVSGKVHKYEDVDCCLDSSKLDQSSWAISDKDHKQKFSCIPWADDYTGGTCNFEGKCLTDIQDCDLATSSKR